MTSTYSTVSDLLLGDLPIPAYISKQKYVDDAADEIDSYIGNAYDTPLDFSVSTTLSRPSKLLVKRIATHLSTGRLLLAVAVASESDNLHEYGKTLVDESIEALNAVKSGDLVLSGADPIGTDTTVPASGPSVKNVDSFSMVEAFYQNISASPPVGETSRRYFPGW